MVFGPALGVPPLARPADVVKNSETGMISIRSHSTTGGHLGSATSETDANFAAFFQPFRAAGE